MWKTLNSPIIITAIIIASLFIFKSQMKPTLANEVRSVYEEIIAIIEDGASDAERTKALQKFAQEIGTQIREGFSAGFKSKEDKKINQDKVYIETKNKIKVGSIKSVKPKWSGRESFIFNILNESDKYIESLKLNYEFYKNGELIDVENKWVSDIKLLEPDQRIALNGYRQIPQGLAKDELKNHLSNEIKIQVTSFNFKELK